MAVSFYNSILLALGGILGYFITNYFCKKFIGQEQKLKPIFLNFGKWRIHFHHWILGSSLFLLIFLKEWLIVIPNFGLGVLGGFIFQDFHCDKDWYKIFLKKGP